MNPNSYYCFTIVLVAIPIVNSLIITSVMAGDKKYKSYSFESKFIPPFVKVEPNKLHMTFHKTKNLRMPEFQIEGNLPLRIPTVLKEDQRMQAYAYPEDNYNDNGYAASNPQPQTAPVNMNGQQFQQPQTAPININGQFQRPQNVPININGQQFQKINQDQQQQQEGNPPNFVVPQEFLPLQPNLDHNSPVPLSIEKQRIRKIGLFNKRQEFNPQFQSFNMQQPKVQIGQYYLPIQINPSMIRQFQMAPHLMENGRIKPSMNKQPPKIEQPKFEQPKYEKVIINSPPEKNKNTWIPIVDSNRNVNMNYPNNNYQQNYQNEQNNNYNPINNYQTNNLQQPNDMEFSSSENPQKKINIGEYVHGNQRPEEVPEESESQESEQSAPSAQESHNYQQAVKYDNEPGDGSISFTISGPHGGQPAPPYYHQNLRDYEEQAKNYPDRMPQGLSPESLYRYYTDHTFTNVLKDYGYGAKVGKVLTIVDPKKFKKF